MKAPIGFAVGVLVTFSTAGAGCSVVSVTSGEGPSRIETNGIVDAHVAVGASHESRLLYADVFEGKSPGAIAEVGIWKLFRVEVGLAGAAVGIGPFDLGLGVLFYDPALPAPIETANKPEGELPPTEVDRGKP